MGHCSIWNSRNAGRKKYSAGCACTIISLPPVLFVQLRNSKYYSNPYYIHITYTNSHIHRLYSTMLQINQ